MWKYFFFTKISCAAASEKLHCNIEKAALQESGAFLPLSSGFQAPTFRHLRLGPAEIVRPPNLQKQDSLKELRVKFIILQT